MNIEERSVYVFTNQITAAWFFAILPFQVIFFTYDPKALIGLEALVAGYAIILWLNATGNGLWARVVASSLPPLIIYLIAAYVFCSPSADRTLSYYVIAISLLVFPFMFFMFRERWYTIGTGLFQTALLVSFEYTNAKLNSNFSSDVYSQLWFQIFAIVFSVIILILGFSFLKNLTRRYQQQVLTLLYDSEEKARELEERENMILHQNSELEEKHQEVRQQRDLIYEHNKSLTNSLYYARRIQNAILPPEGFLKEVFSEVFIINKPRDIVSGDFYWADCSSDKVAIAVGDCTGHGVPGGFLTMLGITLLKESVGKIGKNSPARVLEELKYNFIQSLRQNGALGEASDGIDLGLLIIDRKTGRFQFSGAFSHLYHSDGNTLTEIRGDKMPIGFQNFEEHPFTNHEYPFADRNIFYMLTDGYLDQMNGVSRKKFSRKGLRQLLTDVQHLPLTEQRNVIEKTYYDWKGHGEQIDDVLFIAFEV